MKYFLLLYSICFSISGSAIDAYFNHAVFFDPDNGTYVETHMLFRGESIEYKSSGDAFQARVELTYIFEQNGTIKDFSKTIVKSPFTQDSVSAIVDFLDVQRFMLPAGNYDLTIKLRDASNPSDSGMILHHISFEHPLEESFFSNILILDTIYPSEDKTTVFTRGNVEMLPRISGFQGPDRKKLSIYAELYQSEIELGGEKDFLVTYDLIETKSQLPLDQYRKLARLTGKEVIPLLQTWDISDLPTGNYLVKLEARDRNNKVFAAQSIPIQRHKFVPSSDSMSAVDLSKTFVGKIKREDSLRNMVYCMRYQAELFEERFIDQNWEEGDTTDLRRFMYNFWRDRNAIDPERAWKNYESKISFVEREFGLGSRRRHACATDRGRVYLYYGKPNTRVQRTREPNALPYEIWHYYKTPQKQDAKFVFMDPSAVNNDYVMINSNVPGEVVDYTWYLRLSTYQNDPTGTDEAVMESGVLDINNLKGVNIDEAGSRALDFWNNPR
ncbi:MAG: GWxTD domain-containing protein [Salibacteraceae bacterium]